MHTSTKGTFIQLKEKLNGKKGLPSVAEQMWTGRDLLFFFLYVVHLSDDMS